jgi:hypothetical protein
VGSLEPEANIGLKGKDLVVICAYLVVLLVEYSIRQPEVEAYEPDIMTPRTSQT